MLSVGEVGGTHGLSVMMKGGTLWDGVRTFQQVLTVGLLALQSRPNAGLFLVTYWLEEHNNCDFVWSMLPTPRICQTSQSAALERLRLPPLTCTAVYVGQVCEGKAGGCVFFGRAGQCVCLCVSAAPNYRLKRKMSFQTCKVHKNSHWCVLHFGLFGAVFSHFWSKHWQARIYKMLVQKTFKLSKNSKMLILLSQAFHFACNVVSFVRVDSQVCFFWRFLVSALVDIGISFLFFHTPLFFCHLYFFTHSKHSEHDKTNQNKSTWIK